MTTTNKTYKLPVTLTHHVNFDIDFDKLIDAINKNNFPNCPKLQSAQGLRHKSSWFLYPMSLFA